MPHLASRFLNSGRILLLIGSAISRLSMPTCSTLTYVYQPRLLQTGLHELFNHTFTLFRVCKALVFCLSWLEGDPQRCLLAHVRTLGEKHFLFRQLIHKTFACFVGGSGVCSAIKQSNYSLLTKSSLSSAIYWDAGCIHALSGIKHQLGSPGISLAIMDGSTAACVAASAVQLTPRLL